MTGKVKLENLERQMTEARREMRRRIVQIGDDELAELYYRCITLSEHEAARRALLSRLTQTQDGETDG